MRILDAGTKTRLIPKLNQQKNIPASNKNLIDKDFGCLAGRPDPVDNFVEGGDRDLLVKEGEGQMIRIVAYAVDVREGSKESCNCGLSKVRDTDNHIVLIDPADPTPSLADEKKSLTAEFTPRVRLDHSNLTRVNLSHRIREASHHALLVRVTGLQMFDSYHSLHAPVPKGRKNNWEIHPVFRSEYCPKNKSCTKGSNANWKDLD